MAKSAKPKANPLNNPRSRAARRATSPSLNTDKSLKETPRAEGDVLTPYRGAGIQKKNKKKKLSHAQRVRHEKNLHRAAAVQDQYQNKVSEAKSRLRRTQSRRALWDDVNVTSNEEIRKAIKAPGRFDTLDNDAEDGKVVIEPFHGDTEIKVIDGVQVPAFATGQSMNLSLGPALTTSTKKPGSFDIAASKPQESTVAEVEQTTTAVREHELEKIT